MSSERGEVDIKPRPIPNITFRTIYRTVYFLLLAADACYYLYILFHYPTVADPDRDYIFPIPMGRHTELYVNQSAAYIFWLAVVLTITLSIFGTVKGYIKDFMLDKKIEK